MDFNFQSTYITFDKSIYYDVYNRLQYQTNTQILKIENILHRLCYVNNLSQK